MHTAAEQLMTIDVNSTNRYVSNPQNRHGKTNKVKFSTNALTRLGCFIKGLSQLRSSLTPITSMQNSQLLSQGNLVSIP